MLAEKKGGRQVQLKRAIPVIGRELMQRWSDIDACRVHQDVGSSEGFADQFADPADRGPVAEVRAHPVRGAASRSHLGDSLVKSWGMAGDDDHAGASAGEGG